MVPALPPLPQPKYDGREHVHAEICVRGLLALFLIDALIPAQVIMQTRLQ